MSAWNEKHWIKPELIEQTELLQVKLRLTIVDNTANKSEEDNTSEEKTRKKTREKTREKVLNLIKQDPQITIVQIAAKLDISPKGIEQQLPQSERLHALRAMAIKQLQTLSALDVTGLPQLSSSMP